MNITPQLTADLEVFPSEIDAVEVKYPKKAKISGKIKEYKTVPLYLVLYETESKKIDEENHRVDFDKAVEISIFFRDGKVSSYKDPEV